MTDPTEAEAAYDRHLGDGDMDDDEGEFNHVEDYDPWLDELLGG